jgi:hypothetical protein
MEKNLSLQIYSRRRRRFPSHLPPTTGAEIAPAATLAWPGSGGEDPGHRLLYGASAQMVENSHKQLENLHIYT